MQKLQPKTPIVFVDKADKPWALRAGYDVSVFFPPQKMRRGRPTWLSLGDLRKPHFVSGERCEHRYPCIVEARYADEHEDAIPADRLVLDPVPLNAVPDDRLRYGQGAPFGELYLRPGKYKLSINDQNAHTVFRQDIVIAGVSDDPTPSMPAPPDSPP